MLKNRVRKFRVKNYVLKIWFVKNLEARDEQKIIQKKLTPSRYRLQKKYDVKKRGQVKKK